MDQIRYWVTSHHVLPLTLLKKPVGSPSWLTESFEKEAKEARTGESATMPKEKVCSQVGAILLQPGSIRGGIGAEGREQNSQAQGQGRRHYIMT